MNNENIWTVGLLSGIISSILATFLIWFLRRFFIDTVIPKFRVIFYRGFNISDKWENVLIHDSDRTTHGILELKQIGTSIKGTMDIKIISGGKIDFFSYKIKGEIISNYIKLEAFPTNTKNLTLSCGLFILKDNGQTMEGTTVVVDNYNSNIVGHNLVKWERK